MSDLFQELEEIFDQRMEELLSFVKQLEGQSGNQSCSQSGGSRPVDDRQPSSSSDFSNSSNSSSPLSDSIDSLRESVASLITPPLKLAP